MIDTQIEKWSLLFDLSTSWCLTSTKLLIIELDEAELGGGEWHVDDDVDVDSDDIRDDETDDSGDVLVWINEFSVDEIAESLFWLLLLLRFWNELELIGLEFNLVRLLRLLRLLSRLRCCWLRWSSCCCCWWKWELFCRKFEPLLFNAGWLAGKFKNGWWTGCFWASRLWATSWFNCKLLPLLLIGLDEAIGDCREVVALANDWASIGGGGGASGSIKWLNGWLMFDLNWLLLLGNFFSLLLVDTPEWALLCSM